MTVMLIALRERQAVARLYDSSGQTLIALHHLLVNSVNVEGERLEYHIKYNTILPFIKNGQSVVSIDDVKKVLSLTIDKLTIL